MIERVWCADRAEEVKTVKAMAEPACDPDRGESSVSRSDMAYCCRVGVFLGSILPHRVRVTSAVEKMIDGVAEGEVRSQT
jgi:hypothetical protein